MTSILKVVIMTSLFCGVVSACAVDNESPAALRQGLTTCVNDFDCAFGPNFLDGEHCTFDHVCRTAAQDPSCGLWTGTYPNCDFLYPCRSSYCAPGTECAMDSNLCELPPINTSCSPYVYADPCPSSCEDNDDCLPEYICEESVGFSVCG